MGKIWKPLHISVYKHWVETIKDEASDDLTDWESSFIDSIDEQLSRNKNLTPKQATIVERIYAEKTK